jgi:outer membrane immunogenic protein
MMTNTGICGLLGLVCGIGLGVMVPATPTRGADMTAPSFKAEPAAAAYNWSGFYIGATLGGGMASLPVTDKDDLGPFLNGPALKSGGFVGGLHAGYNWQFAPSFLVGLEGDFSWSNFKSSDATCDTDCSFFFAGRLVASSKLDGSSTLRARFGLTSDRTLIYVTAGPAWGHVNASLSEFACGACVDPGTLALIAGDSSFHLGLAVGGGVEYALTQNWVLRGEYMHLDFGTKDTLFKDPAGVPLLPPIRASSTATADIARIGVSYKVW